VIVRALFDNLPAFHRTASRDAPGGGNAIVGSHGRDLILATIPPVLGLVAAGIVRFHADHAL
jgi:hypothetical protein